jgi:hypothetical protein
MNETAFLTPSQVPAWEGVFIMHVNLRDFSFLLSVLNYMNYLCNLYFIILFILKRLQIISQKYTGIYPPYPYQISLFNKQTIIQHEI